MKLKDGFLMHNVAGEHMIVATGAAGKIFNGLIRNNSTASFIYEQLLKDTTEEEIVAAMRKEYDAPENVIREDVNRIIRQIREAGFLEE